MGQEPTGSGGPYDIEQSYRRIRGARRVRVVSRGIGGKTTIDTEVCRERREKICAASDRLGRASTTILLVRLQTLVMNLAARAIGSSCSLRSLCPLRVIFGPPRGPDRFPLLRRQQALAAETSKDDGPSAIGRQNPWRPRVSAVAPL